MNRILVILPFTIFLFSCSEEQPENKKKQLSTQEVEYISEQMNQWDAQRQDDEIDQYVLRHGWTMSKTKTGVRYMPMEEGDGDSAKVGLTAQVTYDIYLLDGKKVYTSGDTLKDVRIGEDYVESGLHEGLLLMQTGDKMRFILPSYLANGLTGDQDKIGPRQSVLYEIKLHALR
jgi:FKBP-type peptidyl-prolyl cis-trans isomerase FkpA